MYEEIHGPCALDSSALMSWLSKQKFYDSTRPYSSVLNASFASENDRVEYFEELMIGVKPTQAHLRIANIIAKGYADIITTTNFDHLMEYSILQRCKHFPIVIMSKDSPSDQSISSWRAKIFKLHGDYLYGDIRNLDQELSLAQISMSRKLTHAISAGPLLVAGYSGSDASVRQALESAINDINPKEQTVFWLKLKGYSLNSQVFDLLERLGNDRAAICEIDDGDSFFVEIDDSLAALKSSQGQTHVLCDKPYATSLDSSAATKFIQKRLNTQVPNEFKALLSRQPELAPYCLTEGSLDYLLSRFEEHFELPANLGETALRYVDFLSGGYIENRSREYNISQRTQNDLQELGLLLSGNTTKGFCSNILIPLLEAMSLTETRSIEQVVIAMKNGTIPISTLMMYVGLIPSATHIIAEMLISTDVPFYQLLHRCPWPEQYYLAAQLAGAASRVSKTLIDRLVNLLITEFDTEQWFPENATKALTALGSFVITEMVDYITDVGQDVFAREDSAEVLGNVGTRRVIDSLKAKADTIPVNDTLIVDALGRTENPEAISVLVSIAKRLSNNRDDILQEALRKVGYKGPHVVASGEIATDLPYPKRVDIKEAVSRLCPNMPDEKYSIQVTYDIITNYKDYDHYQTTCGTPADIVLLISTAEHLRRQESFQDAEALLLECLLRYPWIYHVYHYLGLLYYQMERFPIARRYFSLGLYLKPNFSGYFTDFGLVMSELGNSDAARYLFVKGITLDPTNHVPWYNLASVNMGFVKAKCKKEYEYNGVTLFKFAKDFQFEANDDLDPYRAAICLKQVLKLKPDHQNARQTLESLRGTFGMHLGDHFPSKEELSYALTYGSLIKSKPIWTEGMPEEAIRLSLEANQMERLGKYQEGIDLMRQSIQIYPYEARSRINIANMAAYLGHLQEAVGTIEEGLGVAPWDHDLLVSKSVFLGLQGETKNSLMAAQKAIRAWPKSASAWIALCQAYYAIGPEGKSSAIDSYHHAMEFCEPWSWVALNADKISKELGIQEGLL